MPATLHRRDDADTQLIGLNVGQEHSTGLDEMFVDALTLPPALALPARDGTLIQREGGDDGLRRAAVCPRASRRLRSTHAACALGRELCPWSHRRSGRIFCIDSDTLFGYGSRYVPRLLLRKPSSFCCGKIVCAGPCARPPVGVRHQQGCRRPRFLFNSMARPRFPGVLPTTPPWKYLLCFSERYCVALGFRVWCFRSKQWDVLAGMRIRVG